MSYLMAFHVAWLFVALLFGIAVGWLTWQRVRTAWMDGAVWIVVAAIVFALVVAISKILPGRPGYWLDLALLMVVFYGLGCAIGWILHELLDLEPVGAGMVRPPYLSKPGQVPWAARGVAAMPTPAGATATAAPADVGGGYVPPTLLPPVAPAVAAASAPPNPSPTVALVPPQQGMTPVPHPAQAVVSPIEPVAAGPTDNALTGAPTILSHSDVDVSEIGAGAPAPLAPPLPGRASDQGADASTPPEPITPVPADARLSQAHAPADGDAASAHIPSFNEPPHAPDAAAKPADAPGPDPSLRTGSPVTSAPDAAPETSAARPGDVTPPTPLAPPPDTHLPGAASDQGAVAPTPPEPIVPVPAGARLPQDHAPADGDAASAHISSSNEPPPDTGAKPADAPGPDSSLRTAPPVTAAPDTAGPPISAEGQAAAAGMHPSERGEFESSLAPGADTQTGSVAPGSPPSNIPPMPTAPASADDPLLSTDHIGPEAAREPAVVLPTPGGAGPEPSGIGESVEPIRPSAVVDGPSDGVRVPHDPSDRSAVPVPDPASPDAESKSAGLGSETSAVLPAAATEHPSEAHEPGPVEPSATTIAAPTGPVVAPAEAIDPEPAASPPVPDQDKHAGARPAGLVGPRGGTKDNLQRIKGIGPQNEGRLHALGVWHFAQIASWTPDNVTWVGSYLAFPGRIDREKWIAQAEVLAAGGVSAKDQPLPPRRPRR